MIWLGSSSLWSKMQRWTLPYTRWSCRSISRPAWRLLALRCSCNKPCHTAHGLLHHHLAQGWSKCPGLDWSDLWPQPNWEPLAGNHRAVGKEATTNLNDLAKKISRTRKILGRKKEFLPALTYSMPSHMESVVDAEGDITKFWAWLRMSRLVNVDTWQFIPVFVIYKHFIQRYSSFCQGDGFILTVFVTHPLVPSYLIN